ncbi:MAG: hypothetical protein M1829_004740 [Trizodia sp. TS-e1964]|nr:MAG: hypothetical protein M1829_004740 [Trizodia sp. TS-e1964]
MATSYYSSLHMPSLASPASSSSSPPQSAASTGYLQHHGPRARKTARLSAHHSHRGFAAARSMKELADAASVAALRARFDAGRSFDLDDDLEFCPGLLTEDDLQSINSSPSDSSSYTSGSSESSPLQHQIQPQPQVTPSFSLSSLSSPYVPTSSALLTNSHAKLFQPMTTTRTRNAIPIVNPTTGMRVASPPLSVSPPRLVSTSSSNNYQRFW